MEYKGYVLNNTDGVKGETLHAWMNAVDDYGLLLARQAVKGDCFEAACEAAKAVREAEAAIDAEYASAHEPAMSTADIRFSELFK